MTVLVRISATGMDQATYDQMAPVLHPLLKKQPGFIMHVASASPDGFTIEEIWETQGQYETWFNENVKPNVPAEIQQEVIELRAVVQP